MRYLYIAVSIIGLLLVISPSILLFTGIIGADMQKTLMVIGTFCWFITAPAWMNEDALEV